MEILLLLFVAGAVVFYLTAKPRSAKINVFDDLRYRAVKIKPCKSACQASSQAAQIIFLAWQAPKLPLNACDRVVDCDCQFRHFADRRQQEARRGSNFVMRDVSQHRERRAAKPAGRRVSDNTMLLST